MLLELTKVMFLVSLTLVPPMLDVGLQIWNGVSINNINFVRQQEWLRLEEEGEEDFITPPEGSGLERESGGVVVFPESGRRKRETGCQHEGCALVDTEPDYDAGGVESLGWLRVEDCGDSEGWGQVPIIGEQVQQVQQVQQDCRVGFVISLASGLTLTLTYQCLATLLLLQLPSLCLAILGLALAVARHGLSLAGARDSAKAVLLALVPFSLLELGTLLAGGWLGEKVKEGLGNLCDCMDLLHFLPCKDPEGRDRILSLSAAKLFFGSCLQLILQTVLLAAYTPQLEGKASQIVSIISSTLIITKTGWDIINFKKKELAEDEKLSSKEKLKRWTKTQLTALATFLIHLPLMLTSLVFHTGTLVLAVLVLGWYSAIPLILIYLTNLLLLTTPQPLAWLRWGEYKAGLTPKLASKPQDKDTRVMVAMWVSWTNMFVLSRLVEQASHPRLARVAVMQPIRAILNLILLVTVLVLVNSVGTSIELHNLYLINKISITFGVILFIGGLHQVLLLVFLYKSICCWNRKIYDVEKSAGLEENDILLKPLEETKNEDVLETTTLLDKTEEVHDDEQTIKEQLPETTTMTFIDDNADDEIIEEKTNIDIIQEKKEELKIDFDIQSNNESQTKKAEVLTDTETAPFEEIRQKYEDAIESKTETEVIVKVDEKAMKLDSHEKVEDLEDVAHLEEVDDVISASRYPNARPSLSRSTSADQSCEIYDSGLQFIVKHSSLAEEEVEQHFRDILGSGKVNTDVFSDTISRCYPMVDTEKLQKHIFKVFGEGDEIDFRKFMLVVYALSNGDTMENLTEIFRLVDRNGDEEITCEELQEVVHDIFLLANERKLSVAHVETVLVAKAFQGMDLDKDGKVILSEFIRACSDHDFIVINYIKQFASMYQSSRRK